MYWLRSITSKQSNCEVQLVLYFISRPICNLSRATTAENDNWSMQNQNQINDESTGYFRDLIINRFYTATTNSLPRR